MYAGLKFLLRDTSGAPPPNANSAVVYNGDPGPGQLFGFLESQASQLVGRRLQGVTSNDPFVVNSTQWHISTISANTSWATTTGKAYSVCRGSRKGGRVFC